MKRQAIRRLAQLLQDYEQAFPLLTGVEAHLKKNQLLAGKTIGWHCHLTDMTVAAARVLVESGARLVMSEANAATTSAEAVGFMQQELGCQVFTGNDSCLQVIKARPEVVSDTGFVLIESLLAAAVHLPYGACEITQSGISKLRLTNKVPFPVINVNSGRLKTNIENFHGVGEGIVAVLHMMASHSWRDRSCLVIGYGRVGAGIAEYLRRDGLKVFVYDRDPVLQLQAYYDGFGLGSCSVILSEVDLLVTATGHSCLVSVPEWEQLKHEAVVINAGHWSSELDIAALKKLSFTVVEQGFYDDYQLKDKNGARKTIRVACRGNPANIVLLTGSHEPTFIHLACEILSLEYLCGSQAEGRLLPTGEILIPDIVEKVCAELALAGLLQAARKKSNTSETVYFEKDG